MQRPNLQKYFYHTSINFPPQENLSNEMMKQIGQDYLNASGFTQHQFIMFRHHDADHPHLHILVNRIGYDGKVLSDSNDFQRSEKILRDLEIKYNLTKVTPSREVKESAMTKDEWEMMKRTKEPSQKLNLQRIIKKTLEDRPGMTTGEFIRTLESRGVNVLFNQATTGFVSGISYDYGGFPIKGAKLGNDFKWASIKDTINYEQERDRTPIHEANLRTKANRIDSGTGTHNDPGDRAVAQEISKRNGGLFPIPDTAELFHSGHAKSDSATQRPGRPAHDKILWGDRPISEEAKGFPLGSLLDGHTHGDNRYPDHQPDLDTESLRRRRKKKRKGRRL